MKRSVVGLTFALVVVSSAFVFGGPVDAQDGAEATIAALQTRVAELEATVDARGDKINAQRTQIADLKTKVPEPTPKPQQPQLGETIKIGSWEIVIVSTNNQATAGQSINMVTARGVFLAVYLTVTNTGNTPAEFPIEALRVIDNKGRTYQVQSEATFFENAYLFDFYTNDPMQPGLAYQEVAIFDVPPDASGFTLTTGKNEFKAALDR